MLAAAATPLPAPGSSLDKVESIASMRVHFNPDPPNQQESS
jgi:hypothetical protein